MTRVQESGYTFTVEADGRWLALPTAWEGDAADWAGDLVDQALVARGVEEPAVVRQLYVQSLAGLGEQLASRDREGGRLVAAYALVPGEDIVPVTAAELEVLPLEPGMTHEHLADGLTLPQEQRYTDPQLDEFETEAGVALRVKQVAVVEEPDGRSSAATLVAFVWPGPVDGTAVLLHAYFGSPVHAELHEDELDDLARSLTVTEVRSP